MPEAVLPILVGEESAQTLEEVEVKFPEPAVEVDEPVKRVEIDECEVITGKVIIVGRLIVNVPFKTRGRTPEAEQEQGRTRIICGDLRHCTAFIPFRLFIEIPGAMPGDECQVVRACVNGEVDRLIDDTNCGHFNRLIATIDIDVKVRVVRDSVVNVFGARRSLRAPRIPFPR